MSSSRGESCVIHPRSPDSILHTVGAHKTWVASIFDFSSILKKWRNAKSGQQKLYILNVFFEQISALTLKQM